MVTKELTTELLHTISAQRNVCEDNNTQFEKEHRNSRLLPLEVVLAISNPNNYTSRDTLNGINRLD